MRHREKNDSSPDQRASLVEYLRSDHKNGLAGCALRLLNEGRNLLMMRVVGYEAIGNLRTAWGPSLEKSMHEHLILVREVDQKPNGWTLGDASIQEISTREQKLANGPLPNKITALDDPSGIVILDGNHTTLANFYHARRHQRAQHALLVHLIKGSWDTEVKGIGVQCF